jgi:hypothetical protein
VNEVLARFSDVRSVKGMAAGLFLEPADSDSNNESCRVIFAAARQICFL